MKDEQSPMNAVCMKNTAKKVLDKISEAQHLKHNSISNEVIAEHLGLPVVSYISMLRRENQHKKIPRHAWEKFRNFVNSGELLFNYQFKDDINKPKKAPETLDSLQGGKSKEVAASVLKTPQDPSPFIKEIITLGTPLNKKIEALINAEPGQDQEYKIIIDIKISVNNIKI